MHRGDYYQTLARVQTYRQLPIAALDANLRAFALNSQVSSLDSNIQIADINSDTNTYDNTSDNSNIIWQQLSQLSQWQHQQLLKMAPLVF